MTAKLKVGLLVVLVIASSAAFAASANTTANIDRSSNVNVVSDDAGLIALDTATPGSGIVSQNTTGALTIDFAQNGSTGVNSASTFEIGNQNDPTTSSAFNITNQDSTAHSVNLGYALTNTEGDGDDNIQFKVYNSTGSTLTTASEHTDGSTTLNSGETAYVVIVVDTHGLGSSDDLTGTLTVSV